MKPELSVAIIFKNEIRCIERCLKSLAPLKERVSCEIVMADTGSTDGSRAIAEQYADVVFDFPWINDFSAARNAVLDRCSGAWALVIDCDEWLDTELDELTSFLKGSRRDTFDQVMLTIRNYASADFTSYGDSRAYRLLRLSSEPRFEGAIHESPEFAKRPRNGALERTLLHHDGYVMLNDGSEAGRAKAARNVQMLRAELEKTPDDLRRLSQFLESGGQETDYLDQLRRAVELVKAHAPEWERYGAMLLRFAVQSAYDRELPELDEWAELALMWFPTSWFTRIDTAYLLTARDFNRNDFKSSIDRGEDYLRACHELKHDAEAWHELEVGVLQRDDGDNERDIRAILAHSYLRLGQPAKALSQLRDWAWEETDARQVKNFIIALQEVRNHSDLDVMPLLLDCRGRISRPVPSEERARERMEAFGRYCTITIDDAAGVSPELLALAEKVRALLAKLPPDDPMALELKASEAYQKIAFLLEK